LEVAASAQHEVGGHGAICHKQKNLRIVDSQADGLFDSCSLWPPHPIRSKFLPLSRAEIYYRMKCKKVQRDTALNFLGRVFFPFRFRYMGGISEKHGILSHHQGFEAVNARCLDTTIWILSG